MLCCVVLCSVVLCCVVLCCVVLRCVVLCCILSYGVVLCCVASTQTCMHVHIPTLTHTYKNIYSIYSSVPNHRVYYLILHFSYLLQPGEKLNQTRRSIDLARDAGSRSTPSFIIIGAQKSGTTSLYELICQHPLVIRGVRRETHCFDWRWDDNLKTIEEQKNHYMKFFNRDALVKYPSLLTGESTPSYLFHSDIVIPRFLEIAPLAKVLVMLRNPVDRAYSQYQVSYVRACVCERERECVCESVSVCMYVYVSVCVCVCVCVRPIFNNSS